ncbi:hypothetical protein V8C86DRAFT_1460131 [Haematococcus lacustris]
MSWSPRSVAVVCHELHWLHSQLRHCCDVAGRLSCRVTLAGSCRRHTLTIARAQTALASHSSHLPLVSLCSSPSHQTIPCSRRTTTSVKANQQDASGVAHPADAAGAVPGDAGHHPAHHHVRDHGPAVLAHHRASVHHHQAPQHRAVLPSGYLVVAPLAIPVGGILAFLFEAKKIACSFFTVLTPLLWPLCFLCTWMRASWTVTKVLVTDTIMPWLVPLRWTFITALLGKMTFFS